MNDPKLFAAFERNFVEHGFSVYYHRLTSASHCYGYSYQIKLPDGKFLTPTTADTLIVVTEDELKPYIQGWIGIARDHDYPDQAVRLHILRQLYKLAIDGKVPTEYSMLLIGAHV